MTITTFTSCEFNQGASEAKSWSLTFYRLSEKTLPGGDAARDALIAAIAPVHGMAVITRNVADFKPEGVVTINPWEAQK